jgi:lipopolysaccharide/colanic/teichoic acid biosynthesis glycosyltransferase
VTERTLAAHGATRDLDSLSQKPDSGRSPHPNPHGPLSRSRSDIDNLVRRLQVGPAGGRTRPSSSNEKGIGGPRRELVDTTEAQPVSVHREAVGDEAPVQTIDLTTSSQAVSLEPTEVLLARRLAHAQFVILPNTGFGYRVAKRATDIIGALILMILTFPIFIALVVLIRLDSPGPALFKQTRVTKNGRHFTFYKFRTMFADARERFPEFYDLAKLAPDDDAYYKLADDPRNTRVGVWLRRTTLDELPNLFNVLRGDISLVGPRPDLPEMISSYTDLELSCLLTKAGITGSAQTRGRSLLTVRERLKVDLFYVSHQSLWLDCKLLIRTVLVVLIGRGAF